MAEYPSSLSEMSERPRPDSVVGGSKISRKPDGTIVVEGTGSTPRIPQKGDFDENLADKFDQHNRLAIADTLMEFKRVDIESRKDWTEREQRALEILGIKDIPKDKQRAPGLHNIVHPCIAMACVQFHSRAIAEFFPPSGPVKGAVIGKSSEALEDQADRIETFMNYYLTEVDRGYYEDCHQMLFYLPISGTAFRKCSPDWRTGLPQLRYIKATNFIAPYIGTSLDTMPRYAHAYTMSGQEINRAMAIGTLMETTLIRPPLGEAHHSKTADTADLRVPILHEDDEMYPVLEYHVEMALDSEELEDDERGVVLPWIILIEESNREVLLVRRNWKEEDESRAKRIWFTKYGFLPGLGFYDFGFPHLIGSLGLAASAAVNCLLDAGLVSTIPGGFITKEGKGIPGGELVFEPGVFKQVDLPYEDLAKAFFKPDLGKPEPAMFQLLELLVQTAQQFSSVTEVNTGAADNRGPVGTTVALIEESSRVQTAIHKRMHASAKEEFRMLAEFISEYMPNQYDYDQNQQTRFLLKSDFSGQVEVHPVSDPNIFSSSQRIALCQAVVELQAQAPDLYSKAKRVAAHTRLIKAMRVPDPEEVAPEDDAELAPTFLDPISENQLIAVSQAVHAFPHQDHGAHLQIHHNFLQLMQAVPMDPQDLMALTAAISAHIREHAALNYRNTISQQMGIELPPFDMLNPTQDPIPPDIERKISILAAQHLPPPPPPPGAAQQAQEGQQVINKAQATIQAKNMDAKAKVERDTQAFIADQKRKDAAHLKDQQRKDQVTGSQLIRDRAKTTVVAGHAKRTHAVQHVNSVRDLQLKEAQRALAIRADKEKHALAIQQAEDAVKMAKKKAAAKPKPKPKKK